MGGFLFNFVFINMIKMIETLKLIVEQNVDDYDDNDFMDAFVSSFKNWVSTKFGEDSKKYPFSYFVKKYWKDFVRDVLGEEENQRILNNYGVPVHLIGKQLIRKGKYYVPSMRPEKKFTEKYKRHIQNFIESLDLPSWVRISFDEPVPNDVTLNISTDFPEMLKSEISIQPYDIQQNVKHFFQDFLGAEMGIPSHGGMQFNYSTKTFNEDAWVKNELNKKIKKDIKAMDIGKYIHSIRFEPKITTGEMKVVFKENTWGRGQTRWDIRNKIKNYLSELGYKRINVNE